MEHQYLCSSKAAAFIDVTITTLKAWESEGKITPLYTPGGHRRYKVADLEALLTNNPNHTLALGVASNRAKAIKTADPK